MREPMNKKRLAQIIILLVILLVLFGINTYKYYTNA